MSLIIKDNEYEFIKSPKKPITKIKNNGKIWIKKEVEILFFLNDNKNTKKNSCKKKFILYEGKYISHKTRRVKKVSNGFLKINKIKI